ncbi:MAG: aminomethyl-transferring glycine dehydrogenase [Planctomycetota bacterium]
MAPSTQRTANDRSSLPVIDSFEKRHIGPRDSELGPMLEVLGFASLDELTDAAIPPAIRQEVDPELPPPLGETEVLDDLQALAGKNRVFRSYIGMGYHDSVTPPVIQRNILENPGWYTQYTPYQAEISQGRMEALFNFQTMVAELCGMEVANASLLDEATAAAEGMVLCRRVLDRRKSRRDRFFVADSCHPQTIEVVRTRADALGIRISVGSPVDIPMSSEYFGGLLQYPDTTGAVGDAGPFCKRAHELGALVVVATDLLALTLLKPPGEFDADVVVGSSQRLGVPLGYGGPHAAFLATREAFVRQVPGRIIGLSKDARGAPAFRLSLQTREQHIRREKATSNICTAQVLLAVIASTYAVYHGPEGLTRIAERIRRMTAALAADLEALGHEVLTRLHFDTLHVRPASLTAGEILANATKLEINLRDHGDGTLGVALDETVGPGDLEDLHRAFGGRPDAFHPDEWLASTPAIPPALRRTTPFLQHPVFMSHHSETELLRYLHRLQTRDLSLTTSMIPLGSCTMKLNATTEMLPVSWPGFARLHPFVPLEQARGYAELHRRLERWLAEITGFAATSLQPNAGSQGEYAGLLVIRAWHRANGEGERDVCLIPGSAHGTNPASARMAGMEVVVIGCDEEGNIDLSDLRAKAAQHRHRLAALMITYPSTHGVFELAIREICGTVHEHGGQVYLDGANLTALVGLCRPGDFGADVCHLNLHKTFCIPHGGGGPGMGPICVAGHLAPFLPGHPVIETGGPEAIGAVAAAPWGSPSILPISYAYIAMMGADGLRRASQIAILNANYMAKRLEDHYPVLYRGPSGLVAHECILDLRGLASAGVEVADVAKRLMDHGFHAPTMSWPVPGTLMVEPTESESRQELDRYCAALIAIRQEIREIEEGTADREDNLLKNAPHTAEAVCADDWPHGYSRERAAFPSLWTRRHKYWPPVARVDDVYGDRNLVCSCPPLAACED